MPARMSSFVKAQKCASAFLNYCKIDSDETDVVNLESFGNDQAAKVLFCDMVLDAAGYTGEGVDGLISFEEMLFDSEEFFHKKFADLRNFFFDNLVALQNPLNDAKVAASGADIDDMVKLAASRCEEIFRKEIYTKFTGKEAEERPLSELFDECGLLPAGVPAIANEAAAVLALASNATPQRV